MCFGAKLYCSNWHMYARELCLFRYHVRYVDLCGWPKVVLQQSITTTRTKL